MPGEHVVDQARTASGSVWSPRHRLRRPAGLRDQLDRALEGQVGDVVWVAAPGCSGRWPRRARRRPPARARPRPARARLPRRARSSRPACISHDNRGSRRPPTALDRRCGAGQRDWRTGLADRTGRQDWQTGLVSQDWHAGLADWGAMSDPYDVLVVCEGNLCRSPLAERLLTSAAGGVARRPRDAERGHARRRRRADGRLGRGRAGPARRRPDGVRGPPADGEHGWRRPTSCSRPPGRSGGQVVATGPGGPQAHLHPARARRPAGGTPVGRPRGRRGARTVVARAADWRASVSGLGDDLDVPDPIGRSAQVHRAAADSPTGRRA